MVSRLTEIVLMLSVSHKYPEKYCGNFHNPIIETVIGQYPLKFAKAMSKCTRAISVAEMATLKEREGVMISMNRTKSFVTETDMDEFGVVSVNRPNTVCC